jgi:low affinity Fe/Cu permease
VLVVVSLVIIGVEDTNMAISIATLLMGFVLQNTQNRDSAALHLQLDDDDSCEPDAPKIVRGTEVKSEAEIKGMTEEKADSLTPAE